MQPTRRELLGGLGAGVAAATAGCSGQLTAEGAAFGAAELSLSASVQDETDYTHYRTEPLTITRQFERFGFSREVEVTNVVSEYDRSIDLPALGTRLRAAVFATLSTPQVNILGRSFNPVADMPAPEIVAMIQEHYDQIRDVQEDGTFETTVGDEPAEVTRFTATARLLVGATPVDVEVYLYVSEAVTVDEDLLVGIAVHPTFFGEARETVATLLAGVERSSTDRPSSDQPSKGSSTAS
jgi:hypothetical protein